MFLSSPIFNLSSPLVFLSSTKYVNTKPCICLSGILGPWYTCWCPLWLTAGGPEGIVPGVKYVFVFVFANTNTNTGVFVFVFEWIWNHVFVFVFDSRILCIWQIHYQIQSICLQILSTWLWMFMNSLWYVISCIRDILSGPLDTQRISLFKNCLSPWSAEPFLEPIYWLLILKNVMNFTFGNPLVKYRLISRILLD